MKWIAPKEHARIFENLERIFKLPRSSAFAKMFARQMWRAHRRNFLFTIKFLLRRDWSAIGNMQRFCDDVRRDGRTFLFVTAHLGAWELAGAAATRSSSVPVHVLAKPPKQRWLLPLIAFLRRRLGLRVLWVDGSLKTILKILQKRETLGFVMDQKPENRIGPKVQFFKQSTPFVSGPATFALKYHLPVMAVFCLRRGDGTYELQWQKVESANRDEHTLTQDLATILENKISAYPEQWTWNYKRWKD